MTLEDQHIDFIRQDIRQKGVSIDELAESLVDHICCYIENSDYRDFHQAYYAALSKFGRFGPKEIQENTIYLLNHQKEITMKKSIFILGYFSAMLITTGLLFKIMHWPPASILLVTGVALLNFGFLPLYFYRKYKQSLTA